MGEKFDEYFSINKTFVVKNVTLPSICSLIHKDKDVAIQFHRPVVSRASTHGHNIWIFQASHMPIRQCCICVIMILLSRKIEDCVLLHACYFRFSVLLHVYHASVNAVH